MKRVSSKFVFAVVAAAAAAFVVEPSAGARDRGFDRGAGPLLVVGDSLARSCYEAARSRSSDFRALKDCNDAFRASLSRRNRVATHVNRSIVKFERGDYAGALDDLNEALERDPELAAIHMNFGEVYTRMQRWTEADAAFTRSLELNVREPHRAYFGRAIVREEAGDLEGAYADYVAASELSPQWTLPRRELERFVVRPDGAAGGA